MARENGTIKLINTCDSGHVKNVLLIDSPVLLILAKCTTLQKGRLYGLHIQEGLLRNI